MDLTQNLVNLKIANTKIAKQLRVSKIRLKQVYKAISLNYKRKPQGSKETSILKNGIDCKEYTEPENMLEATVLGI